METPCSEVVLTVRSRSQYYPEPLMLILRGEQGVLMGFTRPCVFQYSSTFLSDLDERVFLCLLEDVGRKA